DCAESLGLVGVFTAGAEAASLGAENPVSSQAPRLLLRFEHPPQIPVQPCDHKIYGEVDGKKADVERNEDRRFHKVCPDQRRGIGSVTILACDPWQNSMRHQKEGCSKHRQTNHPVLE